MGGRYEVEPENCIDDFEMVAPYSKDSVEREINMKRFKEHYSKFIGAKVNIVENYDSRAAAFNSAIKKSTCKFIAIADIDAIINFNQINNAIDMINRNQADMVYPFDKVYNWHPNYSITDDWPKNYTRGLMIIIRKDKFLEFGGENENFRGWGYDDEERYYRALNHGYRVGRVSGTCLHMMHPRFAKENPYLKHNFKIMSKERRQWKETQGKRQIIT